MAPKVRDEMVQLFEEQHARTQAQIVEMEAESTPGYEVLIEWIGNKDNQLKEALLLLAERVDSLLEIVDALTRDAGNP